MSGPECTYYIYLKRSLSKHGEKDHTRRHQRAFGELRRVGVDGALLVGGELNGLGGGEVLGGVLALEAAGGGGESLGVAWCDAGKCVG